MQGVGGVPGHLYWSDFHGQWFILKIRAGTIRICKNIDIIAKENVEEIAVEKTIFPAEVMAKPGQGWEYFKINLDKEWQNFIDCLRKWGSHAKLTRFSFVVCQ